jgi:molybdopterin converting factor subunit 1
MKIQLLFFGITTDLTEKNSMVIEVESTTSVKNLKQQLISKFPKLQHINEFAIAVNEEYATDDFILTEGAVVAIIPPVSGG